MYRIGTNSGNKLNVMQEKEKLSNIWGDHVAVEQKEKRLLYIIVVVTLSCAFILIIAACTVSVITAFTDIFHPNKGVCPLIYQFFYYFNTILI